VETYELVFDPSSEDLIGQHKVVITVDVLSLKDGLLTVVINFFLSPSPNHLRKLQEYDDYPETG
jgi:hypothetical protein